MNVPLLTLIVFSPLVGAVLLALLPREPVAGSRRAAFVFSLVPLGLALWMLARFQTGEAGFQMVERAGWIPQWGIEYRLAVDGVSLFLVLLTAFLVPIVVLASWTDITRRVKEFFAFLLVLETGMLGAFLATDLFLFYVFWEVMLVPMYFLIGVWGGGRRVYAAVKFVLFTLVGSLLMLVAILYCAGRVQAETGGFGFGYDRFLALHLTAREEAWLFAAFALAFAIKVPLFPLHTWLPDAHVEAPTGGSVILAGVLLKLGTYGFLRFALPLFPHAAVAAAPLMIALAVIGIVYGALVATVQPDLKKLVAYSSVSHLGFVVLGLFVFTGPAAAGSVLQMLNHGLSTGGLFLMVGMIYERRHTRRIADFGGLWSVIPVYAVFFLIVMLASVGLPGLNGFVGEFLILLGAFGPWPWATAVATTGVILAALYLLWMYQRVVFGPLVHEENARLQDLSAREVALLVPVVALCFLMGLYPAPFLTRMQPSIDRMLARVQAPAPVASAAAVSPAAMTPIDTARWAAHWEVALPGLIVAGTAMLVMVADLVTRDPDRDVVHILGIGGLLAAAGAAIWLWIAGTAPDGFAQTLRADRYALFFTVLVCAGSTLTLLMSVDYLRDQPIAPGEYGALVLLSTCGMVFLAAANDLIVLFLALEVMSVAVYVLTGMLRRDPRSTEAALKYFLLGAFATGFLLYGIAFFYGAAGSTRLTDIGAHVARHGLDTFTVLGIALLLVGLGFKVAMVPFHVWTPDTYQGAPTAVTAFMAVGVKAAAFAALARVFLATLAPVAASWTGLVWVLAALTMTIGNVTAVLQRNVKRMLAYSSIAHAGYALVGLVPGTEAAGSALLFYLFVYTFMTLGAFGVLIALGRRGEPNEELAGWAGVGFRHPVLGLAMVVFMLSLAGIPPTAGFAGKFYLFSAAINAGYVGLAVVAVVNSLISVAYYFGVLVQMYMAEGGQPVPAPGSRPWLLATIVLAGVATLWVGILPAGPMALARAAFVSLK